VDKQVLSEVAFSGVNMPGMMNRTMIYASFKLNRISVNFGATHLESPTDRRDECHPHRAR